MRTPNPTPTLREALESIQANIYVDENDGRVAFKDSFDPFGLLHTTLAQPRVSAESIAVILAEHAEHTDGVLSNVDYLAVKIAESIESTPEHPFAEEPMRGALEDLVAAWRSGDPIAGHEAIGFAEAALATPTPSAPRQYPQNRSSLDLAQEIDEKCVAVIVKSSPIDSDQIAETTFDVDLASKIIATAAERTYKQGYLAGLQDAAKIAEANDHSWRGLEVACAIRALQSEPPPAKTEGSAEEPWDTYVLLARKAIYSPDGRGMIGANRNHLIDRVARAIKDAQLQSTPVPPSSSTA